MVQLISMNEPGLITRSYHRYLKVESSKIHEYSKKIINDLNIEEFKLNLSLDQYEQYEDFYKSVCDESNYSSIKFGLIIKSGSNIKTLLYTNNDNNKTNDYTFVHENYLIDKLDDKLEENILFETDLNEVLNLFQKEGNYIILLMRPIPMDRFLSAVNSGDRLPPKVTNFLPKPPAGLVFQSLEGYI